MGDQRAPRSSLRRLAANAVLVVALIFGGASGLEGTAAAATHSVQAAAAVAGAGVARPQLSPHSRFHTCLALRRTLIRLRVLRAHSPGQRDFVTRVIERLRDRIDRVCGGARAPSGA